MGGSSESERSSSISGKRFPPIQRGDKSASTRPRNMQSNFRRSKERGNGFAFRPPRHRKDSFGLRNALGTLQGVKQSDRRIRDSHQDRARGARILRLQKHDRARGDRPACVRGLLVVDEIGAGLGTDHERAMLNAVICGRYDKMRPTILISNLDMAGIRIASGERILDRIKEDEGSAIVPMNWPSWRGKK